MYIYNYLIHTFEIRIRRVIITSEEKQNIFHEQQFNRP